MVLTMKSSTVVLRAAARVAGDQFTAERPLVLWHPKSYDTMLAMLRWCWPLQEAACEWGNKNVEDFFYRSYWDRNYFKLVRDRFGDYGHMHQRVCVRIVDAFTRAALSNCEILGGPHQWRK